eukprot:UN02836
MNDSSHNRSNNDLYVIPDKSGGRLRACLSCKLIKAERDFSDVGCENCPQSVEIYGSVDNWATPSFVGMCALMEDNKSWVAKHQRIVRLVPGLYAIATKGRLSKENEDDHDDIDE